MPFSTAVRTSKKGCTVALFQRICCALFMRLATISFTALSTPPSGRVGHQRTLIAFEVAQQIADAPLHPVQASHVAHGLASRPAAQGRELAPAPRPAPVPETPLRTVQGATRRVGEVAVGRARAETPRCLP